MTHSSVTRLTPPLVAVVGPTASGKTAWGERLALAFQGEIVSADAKQVFRGMDIGTAKEKQLKVPQHLLDIKEPGERLTAAEYQALAYREIDRLIGQGKQPFLVGGSMLYAESVLNGYRFSGKGEKRSLPRYRTLKLGIAIDRDVLRQRIAARTGRWVTDGLLAEIDGLLERGVSPDWLRWCGQEYRYFTGHVLGELSLAEAIDLTNISINQYVKRQYTWWRRHSDLLWLTEIEEAVRSVEAFLQEGNVV